MEEQAIRGVRWTLLGYAVNKLVTFGATVVLARLLTPADFGLVSLAILAIGILGVFGDLGFGAAQVVRQDLDREDQRTVLSVTLGSTALVSVLAAAASPLAAAAFDEPRLDEVLVVLAVNNVFAGLGWFYETLLQRELEFRPRFVARVAQAVVYAAVALTLALLDAGVWSIVVAQIAGTACYAGFLLALAPYRVAPGWRAPVARDVFRTGRGFVVQGGVAFLRQNLDFLAVGATRGARDLGLYSLAYRVAELPKTAVADPIATATFPGFARMRAAGVPVAGTFVPLLRNLALVLGVAGLLLSACASPFVRLVYGDQWLPMVDALTLLGLWALLRPLEVTVGWLLNSVGEAGILGRVSTVSLILLAPSLFAAAELGGITAVAAVLLGEIVLSSAAVAVIAGRRAGVTPRDQWRAVRGPLIAVAPGWAVARAVASAVDEPSGLAFAVSAGAGVVTYLLVVTALDRRALPGAVGAARRALGRS
jgi:O-antigen/teichoic acid export membrane protein